MPAQRTRNTLEVDTHQHPETPILAIISPTPRAFTFPITHNLDAPSPYSSPSTSPFEPDLRSFVYLPQSSSPDHLIRTLSPPNPTPSPSASSHKRRKSSSSDAGRRPKKGDDDYIKRPENAFILFRRKCVEEAHEPGAKKRRQADLSKTISQQWKSLSTEERQYWEGLAKEKKKEHEAMYPDYVYRPQRTKGKNSARKTSFGREDEQTLNVVVPVASRQHGRSASAPTPPLPYQTLQIPFVHHKSPPSCPASPDLGRRTSYQPDTMLADNGFDYVMPQFGTSFESFQAPQYQNMGLDPLAVPGSSQSQDPFISPVSSGPSSPNSGPFTPTSVMLSNSFSGLTMPYDCNSYENSGMQLNLDCAGAQYSYESSSLWPAGTEILLSDDFDINAIPPIQIDMSKYASEGQDMELSPLDQFDQRHYSMGFDDMMAGHGF